MLAISWFLTFLLRFWFQICIFLSYSQKERLSIVTTIGNKNTEKRQFSYLKTMQKTLVSLFKYVGQVKCIFLFCRHRELKLKEKIQAAMEINAFMYIFF